MLQPTESQAIVAADPETTVCDEGRTKIPKSQPAALTTFELPAGKTKNVIARMIKRTFETVSLFIR
ncbi:MAG: hypothetical protein AAB948_00275 [Patescibacteria group bacterium]